MLNGVSAKTLTTRSRSPLRKRWYIVALYWISVIDVMDQPLWAGLPLSSSYGLDEPTLTVFFHLTKEYD